MKGRLLAWLRLFLPVALLVGVVAYAYIDSHRQSKLTEIRATESLYVGLGAAMLDRRLQVIRDDLNYLARLNAIEASADGALMPDMRRMAQTFAELLRTKPVYDQARWIDASGQEILRVDLKAGQPVVVARDKLQSKADRDYFTEAMKLEAGQVYVSPIDLKVDNEAIEVPHQPILRLATPLLDGHGEKRGIIILNYLAEEMFAHMETVTTTVADHLMLVNTTGYFLHAPNAADEWGFMFNDGQRSLPARFPESWVRLDAEDHGQFIDAQGLWTFHSVYPLRVETPGITGLRGDERQFLSGAENSAHWRVVTHLTPAQLAQLVRHSEVNIYPWVLLLLALFAVVAFAMVRASELERRAELRFKVFFERAMVGMAMTSIDKQWIAVNPALCRILGYPAEVLVSKTWEELTHPEDVAANVLQFERALRGEIDVYELEKRFARADGTVVNTFIATQVVRKRDGRPDYFMVIVEDITQRKQVEQMLEMQARRATALLALPQKSVELEEPAFMAYVLDLAEELTGSEIGFMHFVDPDAETIELVAWSTKTLDKYCQAAFDCHYPITKAGIWADAARQKRPVVINDYATAENNGGLPAGHSALLRLISIPVIEGGKVRMMTGVGNKASLYTESDVETVQLLGNEAWRIVRRQRAEKALKIANQVVSASPVVCFRWAPSEGWPVVFVSDNVRQWGYLPADLQAGRPPFADLVHPDDLPRVVEEVTAKTDAGCAGYEIEYRIVTPKNRLIWVVDRSNILRDADGKILFCDGVLTDITDRKTQQLALARNLSEQRELNCQLEEAHNQLLQSEKMASIGQLAAGIAHELNNPIGFVHSNLGTLDGYVRDLMEIIAAYEALARTAAAENPLLGKIRMLYEERDFGYIRDDIAQLMHESKDGLGRVRRIVQDLKNFSHVSEQEWQWADLHEGLDSTLNIVWNELKYKCNVVKEYGDLPKVHCMISQLNQVFMNLLVNASHAIETQGTVTLRTRCLGDNEVCIEVGDTGKGIAPAHLTRIFEPFFTTKPVGKGTGLGLSLSYGIINKHSGRIEVDSTLGQGTTFRVIIPINQEAGAAGQSSEAFP